MDCDESLPEDETIQDVPLILSSQLYDIFPMFASMLDIKSFMKLAMTSKDMYKRCMEDKAIRINVNENSVVVHRFGDSKFTLRSSVVSRHTESYITALGKHHCRVNLRTLELDRNEAESSQIAAARRYLTELNVKRIKKLVLYRNVNEWEAVIPFIKDFYVNCLDCLDCSYTVAGIPYPVLLSLLQLNLKEFSYERTLPVDILFEVNSPIPKISLTGIENIPKDKFTQILWMIQSDSLHHIIVDVNAVDWSAYDTLPFNGKQKLPEDRPLVFARTPRYSRIQEYWFLHWQGGVTKCVRDEDKCTLEVFKCEPDAFPVVLRKEEDIMKDLREMRSGVSCHLKQFRNFAADFTMFDPSFKGPIPAERPFYFKASERSFWRLIKANKLTHFNWKDGFASCKPFKSNKDVIDHPALAKFMFWKMLKNGNRVLCLCESSKEFNSWFEDCKMLDSDYTGPLPDERPLVFRKSSMSCDMLLDGFRFQCSFRHKSVWVNRHSTWERPLNRVTAKIIKNLLQDTSKLFGNAYVNIPVDMKTFRHGFKLFKSTSGAFGPFAWKTRQDEKRVEKCWYYANGAFMKVVWEDGRLMRTPSELRDFPKVFMKNLFKEFARKGERKMDPVYLELEQFQSCLEQFIVVPFDYSEPLKNGSPLAFMKSDIRNTSEDVIYVWFFWEDMKTTYCSWGENEAHKVLFYDSRDCVIDIDIPIPPALKTKEYLKMLLELRYDVNTEYQWFGDLDDFLAFFNEYKTFPFKFKGELPEERPLVFEDDKNGQQPIRILFREDNSMVKCKWYPYLRAVYLRHPRGKNPTPPALRKFI